MLNFMDSDKDLLDQLFKPLWLQAGVVTTFAWRRVFKKFTCTNKTM